MANLSTARRLTPQESGLACFSTCWLETSIAAVTVHGELDASNSAEFTDYVSALLPFAERLIIDLSAVRFFGTDAFSAVHALSVRAAGQGTTWALIPSGDVARVLRICDPDEVLPARANLTAALGCVRRGARRFPRLVTDRSPDQP
jgi:anti-anti-sigma factor